jgi:undecaprenyl-diphosphatase
MVIMDIQVFYIINRGIHSPILDTLMIFVTERPYIPILLLMVPAFVRDIKKAVVVLLLCLIALAMGDASSNMLKHLFERPRPCHTLIGVRLLVGCGNSFSMPSSHAVNAFAVVATFSHFFRGYTIPMFAIAIAVALSRVYVGVHYPSDVLAGAVWGIVVAGGVILIFRTISRYIKGFSIPL